MSLLFKLATPCSPCCNAANKLSTVKPLSCILAKACWAKTIMAVPEMALNQPEDWRPLKSEKREDFELDLLAEERDMKYL